MVVVSNTSPISNLAIIGGLGLLRDQFGSVLLQARQEGQIGSLQEEIRRLRAEARFFVAKPLEVELLTALRE